MVEGKEEKKENKEEGIKSPKKSERPDDSKENRDGKESSIDENQHQGRDGGRDGDGNAGGRGVGDDGRGVDDGPGGGGPGGGRPSGGGPGGGGPECDKDFENWKSEEKCKKEQEHMDMLENIVLSNANILNKLLNNDKKSSISMHEKSHKADLWDHTENQNIFKKLFGPDGSIEPHKGECKRTKNHGMKKKSSQVLKPCKLNKDSEKDMLCKLKLMDDKIDSIIHDEKLNKFTNFNHNKLPIEPMTNCKNRKCLPGATPWRDVKVNTLCYKKECCKKECCKKECCKSKHHRMRDCHSCY